MPFFKIYHGMGGGFGGAQYDYTGEFKDREEAMEEERRACLAIVRAPHFKPAVRNELAKRAGLIEDRGAR